MNSVLPCYPSTHIHNSTSVTPNAAQSLLEAYLESSTTTAHLHPDAVLTPGGVTYSAASGPRGGLTINHLRRIARGLGGEAIAPSAEELATLEAEGAPRDGATRWGRGLEGIGPSRERAGAARSALKKTDSEWMDMQEFAETREVEEGDVGERDTAAVPEEEEEVEEVPTVAVAGEKRKLTAEQKEARKAEKKKRIKMAQVEREQKRLAK